jgi:hypothetical protein
MEFRVSSEVEAGEALIAGAASFGITPESFITSFPSAGIEAVTIAREGLMVVSRKQADHSRSYIPTQELLKKGTSNPDSPSYQDFTSYPLTDEAEEFSRTKGIPVRDLVTAGGRLLIFAAKTADRQKDGLLVTSRDRRRLDSTLSFRVTTLNTVATNRQKASAGKKVAYRFWKP